MLMFLNMAELLEVQHLMLNEISVLFEFFSEKLTHTTEGNVDIPDMFLSFAFAFSEAKMNNDYIC